MKRIMCIEDKSGGLSGPGRIGWVEMSRTTRSYLYYGRRFLKTSGYKYNCIEEESDAEEESDVEFWISGPKKRGGDKLYGGVVQIDEDARIEYWTKIRNRPESAQLKLTR